MLLKFDKTCEARSSENNQSQYYLIFINVKKRRIKLIIFMKQ